MPLIDTHAHLTDKGLASQLPRILAEAAAADVAAIVNVATDVATAQAAAEQVEQARHVAETAAANSLGSVGPLLFCTAGVHPHQAAEVADGWLSELERLAGNPRHVAVGECGLDYFYDFAPRSAQQRVLAEQVRLAARLRKPLILHCRGKVVSESATGKVTDPECLHDILAILDAEGGPSLAGVFHCFEGTPEQAAEILRRGFQISFTGSLTFKSNESLRRTASGLPLERVMVETDSPYMSPEPHRKVRPCTPAMVGYTANRLAEALGRPTAEVWAATTANAIRLFGLSLPTT